MDPRWQKLPHTDTEFIPAAYPDRASWEAKRAHLKKQVLFAAGLWPLPEKPPLEARIWNRIERDGYSIEKVSFQSLPGFYVGGTLFRPLDPKPKSHPGVLAPHGHSELGRLNESEAASYQARGLTLARIGCTAFMWDMVDYNDSARHLSGAYEDESYGIVHRAYWRRGEDEHLLWNFNILGLQLWNSIRALDFIEQLPEVDPDKLVCTGESGGGTQTYNLYAVDERLAAAAPVCMVSAYMQGGCVCENAPLLRIDTNNVDIGATLAPKPLLLVSSARDWTQHTPEVEYPAIKKIYELYDAGEQVEEVQVDAPHGYNREMREAVYRWLARLFALPIAADYVEPPYELEPRENLLAFFEGLPEGALANHEELIGQYIKAAHAALANYAPQTQEALDENRQVLGTALRLAVGYADTAVGYERTGVVEWEGLPCEDGVFIGQVRGVRVPVRRFIPETPSGTATLLLHPQGMGALYAPIVRSLLQNGQTVYAIDCFGTGGNIGAQNPEQVRGSTPFFSTFNRVDDAERIGDIALALRYVLDAGCEKLNVAAFARAGLWALVAGTFLAADERLRFAFDADGFASDSADAYLEKLPIPGILRAGGLSNAAALLAPRDLLLHNVGEAFATTWAASAYALYGDAAFTVEKGRVDNDVLVDYLNQ